MSYMDFVVCFVTLFVIYWLKNFIGKIKKSPPGPWGVPILGYYPLLGEKPLVKFSTFADKYGEIMTVNYFGEYYYYLNSLNTIKQVLVKNTNYTTDRPDHFDTTSPFSIVLGEKNMLSINGDGWKGQRGFIVSKLAALGMGKSKMEHRILPLCDKLVDYIIKTNGEATDFQEYFSNLGSNVISELLFSKHFDCHDPRFITLRDDTQDFFINCPGIDGGLCGQLYGLYRRWFKSKNFNNHKAIRERAQRYFLPIIEERIKLRENTPFEYEDLLDYCVEKHLQNVEYFDKETIADNFFLWFLGGTETTSSTLYHAINLMILYPEVQQKVQKEIDNVFGIDCHVSYQQRHLLPYTLAVIQEVQRFACLIPFGLSHTNTKPISVTTNNGNYVIPKKSTIMINIWKCSRDGKEFKNPDSFDPHHFLNENGEFVMNESNMPFAVGKRDCSGASLSKIELFLGFVILFQKFQWKSPNNEPVKREIHQAQARILHSFKCCAVPRK